MTMTADAQVISWAYNNGKPIPATGYAGVVSATNWNLTGAAGSSGLGKNDGSASTVTLSLSGGFGDWGIGGVGAPDGDGTYNKAIFDGYYNSLSSTLTLGNVPFTSYDVYVYFSADVDGRKGTISDGTTTYSFKTMAVAATAAGNCLLSKTTDTASGYPSADYALFSGLSGASKVFSIASNPNAGMGICGIQIVNTSLSLTWNGSGADDNWSTGLNWVGGVAPDASLFSYLTFAGSTRTTPNMEVDYKAAGLAFGSSAGGFVIGSANGSALTLGGSGITNNSANAQSLNVPVILSAAQTLNAASGSLTLNSSLNNGGNLLTTAGANSVSFNGAISGAGGLTVSGAGTVTLSGANTFTGALTLAGNSGLVILSGNNANRPAGTTGLTTVSGSSALRLVANTGNTVSGVSYALSAERTANAPLFVNPGATLQLRSDASVTYAGGNGLGGIGNGSITIDVNNNGSGSDNTLTFAPQGFNVFNTTINVTGGNGYTLALGSLVNQANPSETDVSVLNPISANLAVAGLSVNGTGTHQTVLDGATTGNRVLGAISGAQSLTKNGAGTWTLEGANTYTGSTVVNNGTLLVSGSLGGGTVTVSGGRLGGTGTVGGAVTVSSGGTLQPTDTATGTLTINNSLSLSGTTVLTINRDSVPNASKVAGLTALTKGGTLTINNQGAALQGGDTFTLFSMAGSGMFSITSLPTLAAGQNWWTTDSYSTIIVNQVNAGAVSYTRTKGLSLKVNVTDLLTHVASVPTGDSFALTGVGASAQGATVTVSGGYIFYTPVNDNDDSFSYTVSSTRGGSATGTVSINVAKATGLPLGADSLSVAGSTATVNVHGIPNYVYVLQTATSLNGPWWPVATNTAAAEGNLSFIDSNATNSQQFYRVAQP